MTCRDANVLWPVYFTEDDTPLKQCPSPDTPLKQSPSFSRRPPVRFTAGAGAAACLLLCGGGENRISFSAPTKQTWEHQLQSHRCHLHLTSALESTELGRRGNSDGSRKRTGPLVQHYLLDLYS